MKLNHQTSHIANCKFVNLLTPAILCPDLCRLFILVLRHRSGHRKAPGSMRARMENSDSAGFFLLLRSARTGWKQSELSSHKMSTVLCNVYSVKCMFIFRLLIKLWNNSFQREHWHVMSDWEDLTPGNNSTFDKEYLPSSGET